MFYLLVGDDVGFALRLCTVDDDVPLIDNAEYNRVSLSALAKYSASFCIVFGDMSHSVWAT